MTSPDPHTLDIGALAAVLYEGVADPVLVLTDEGRVVEANEPALQLFGGAVIGREFGIPASPGSPTEIDLHTSAGQRTAELRVGRARLDGGDVYVAILRDVTDRKRVEKSLRDFVSTASHEFRTPLFAIQGFAETLREQWDTIDDDERLHFIDVIHRQAQRLTRLTDDLLTVTQIDGDSIEPSKQPTVCQVVVDRVLEILEIEGIEVDVPVDLRVHVDPDHLEDALVNLLTNADKYGRPPLRVIGTVEGDCGVLRVVDHGDGVPTAFRGRMFERFSRERRAARNNPGTGLGLAIVQGLVQRNDGELTYETTPGGGATFVLRFPLPPA